MLPSNFNLNIGKTKGYNNKMLVINIDMKIGSNNDTNKDPKKLTADVPKKIVIPVARHDLKMLTEKDNNEKLAIKNLIVGAGLSDYHCWYKIKWRHCYSHYFPLFLGLGLMQQRLPALALDLVCFGIMVEKNTRDMT